MLEVNDTDKDILLLYFKDIDKYPLLTQDEEIKLIRKIKKGDQQAKEKLINSHLKFVVSTAKNYQYQGLSLLDLINEGNIGLIAAIRKFDISRKNHFISYAVHWIKSSIMKALAEQSKDIRLPLNRHTNLNQIKKYIKIIQEEKNRIPTIIEIAERLHLKISVVKLLLQTDQPVTLLSTPLLTNEDNSDSVGDKISDIQTSNPIDYTINQCCKEDINKILSSLKPKEAEVLEYRFGLNGKRKYSLKEIGDMYGLTKERIRQIQKIALKKLRHPKKMRRLQDYIV